jgi:hypothetical protein
MNVLHAQVPASTSASATNRRRWGDSQARPERGGPGESVFIPASLGERRSGDDEEVRDRQIGFFDVNDSIFLIAYISARPYIEDMKTIPAMIQQGRKTKQGLRDLNYYGPRRVKDAAEAAEGRPAATAPDEEVRREAPPPAEAHDENAVAK